MTALPTMPTAGHAEAPTEPATPALVLRITTYAGHGAVTSDQAAEFFGIGERTFRSMVARKDFPPGVKMGRLTRWWLEDLIAAFHRMPRS